MNALIGLEDGTVLTARSFTGPGEAVGEMVFNTSMSGYQEVLTDPSYTGQLVTMTYPLIGNYGVNPEDMESAGVHPRAFLVREYQGRPSNFRATSTLADFLRQYNVLGVEGLDTRLLTRRLRTVGAMRAVVSTLDLDPDSLVRRARAWAGLVGRDMVARVSCAAPYRWEGNAPVTGDGFPETADGRFRVVAYDFGIKYNQLRLLSQRGCRVRVVPATTPAAEVLALRPDGVFLSNGPGDPATADDAVALLRQVLDADLPYFGICFGNQIFGPLRRHHLQAQVRSPRRQPAGQGSAHRPGGDHRPEPRLLRGPGHPAAVGGGHPHQPQRRQPGGHAPPRVAGLLGPVPPGIRPRPARLGIPFDRFIHLMEQG